MLWSSRLDGFIRADPLPAPGPWRATRTVLLADGAVVILG
jgi:hypothetical protein